MSDCLACAPSLLCSDPADLAVPLTFYATQDYSFVQQCPPGYRCRGGTTTVIRIDQGNVPRITYPPGSRVLRLKGCLGWITRTVSLDITPAELAAVAASMQAEWAQQQVNCGGSPPRFPPSVPPSTGVGTSVGPSVNCIDIGNEAQSYTAYCPAGNCGAPSSVTIAANTYTKRLCRYTAATISATQTLLNNQAAAAAQTQAIAALSCGGSVGNSAIAGNAVCPGMPWITANAQVAACTYTSASPGDQDLVDAKANADLNNQLHDLLAAGGCTCPGPVVPAAGYGTITTNCPLWFTWSKNAPFLIVIDPAIPGSGDLATRYHAFTGFVLTGTSILTPFGWIGNQIIQQYP